MTPESIRIHDELNAKFSDGSVFEASEEDLKRYLKGLCTTAVVNERIRHQEINRCQVIGTIRMFRFLDALEQNNRQFVGAIERSNRKLTGLVVFLTLLAVLMAGWSSWLSYNSARDTQRLVDIQERQLEILEGNRTVD